MLNEKIAKLLNTQINKEFYSAYLYLHFANFSGKSCRCTGQEGQEAAKLPERGTAVR